MSSTPTPTAFDNLGNAIKGVLNYGIPIIIIAIVIIVIVYLIKKRKPD